MSNKKTSNKEGNSSKTTIVVAVIGLIGTIVASVVGPIVVKEFTETPTPAITPTAQARDWYVIFELLFPPNYWGEGSHSYLFKAACPFSINSTKNDEPTYSFFVDKNTEVQSFPIYIRRHGLYDRETFGTPLKNTVNPQQETKAIYGPFATSFEEAKKLRDECQVQISIDNGSFIDLQPTRIDRVSN